MSTGFVYACLFFAPAYWSYFLVLRFSGLSRRFFVPGMLTAVGSATLLTWLLGPSLGPWGPRLVFCAVYLHLWVLALNFMAAIANSVTLQMLANQLERGTSRFTETDILNTYHQHSAVSGRLLSLEQRGLVAAQENQYVPTLRGRLLVLPFQWSQWLFGVRNLG